MAEDNAQKLTCLGKLMVMLVVALCLAGAGYFFLKDTLFPQPGGGGTASPSNAGTPGTDAASGASAAPRAGGGSHQPAGQGVEIGVAYGTEKRYWMEWAAGEFARDGSGAGIVVKLIPLGSLEAAHAILGKDPRIHAWTPASSLYTDTFLQEWSLNQSGSPFVAEERLALTPMVYVFWEERYQAFMAKHKEINFATIRQAIAEPTGWQGIAGKAEWGLFKFGHTHPNESNSGLATLVLLAHEFHRKNSDLDMSDVLNAGFQKQLADVENGVVRMSNSTGNMMRDMVLMGPSTYDVLFVYESVAIDFLKNAEGRWGKLRVAYPQINLWNDNPYYVLNVPWSSPAQRQAAQKFMEFLMSEPVQRKALEHGFRPGNPGVPVKLADSPFVKYADAGIQVDIHSIAPPPKAEILRNLLASWQRVRGNK